MGKLKGYVGNKVTKVIKLSFSLPRPKGCFEFSDIIHDISVRRKDNNFSFDGSDISYWLRNLYLFIVFVVFRFVVQNWNFVGCVLDNPSSNLQFLKLDKHRCEGFSFVFYEFLLSRS